MAINKAEAKAEYVRRIKAEMQRRSAQHTLSDFILYTSDNYLMGWVHKEICDTLRFAKDEQEALEIASAMDGAFSENFGLY